MTYIDWDLPLSEETKKEIENIIKSLYRKKKKEEEKIKVEFT